jgi:hypothetical protein
MTIYKQEKRDNFKLTIVKFFILALFILFTVIGLAKRLIYGPGVPARQVTTGEAVEPGGPGPVAVNE